MCVILEAKEAEPAPVKPANDGTNPPPVEAAPPQPAVVFQPQIDPEDPRAKLVSILKGKSIIEVYVSRGNI